jgi:hypothetical protein
LNNHRCTEGLRHGCEDIHEKTRMYFVESGGFPVGDSYSVGKTGDDAAGVVPVSAQRTTELPLLTRGVGA